MKRSLEHTAGNGGSKLEDPIAIVGLGGVFPAARTLTDFWNLIERGVDTSRPVPPGRWILDPQEAQNPKAGMPDRVYTDRGCFIQDFQLDTTGLDLPPALLESLDPSFHLLLEAGRNALASLRSKISDLSRVGAILGNIALPTSASSALCERVLTPLLGGASQDTPPALAPLGEFAANRYVAGLPAGVLAQALGLGGNVYTIDAACASSLYALKLACDELRAGRADAMLAGGLSRPDSLYTQMGFCQLRALSPTGRCAPFDATGNGLVVGEGSGVVVLKRCSDALRDGDEILALIRGIGLSNDLDGNLLSPSSEGQLRALKSAYEQAGWLPNQVDMIECHATGTPVGDAVEWESLSTLWQGHAWTSGQCVLGAVKANVGHLLTAAGSASLIKMLLALKHNVLPGTANFQRPGAKISLDGSPFRILHESQPWHRRDPDTPRRAAINGFGFGGINAHVLIEEWMESSKPRTVRKKSSTPATPVAIVGIGAVVGPWQNLQAFQERVLGGRQADASLERSDWRGVPAQDLRAYFSRTRFFPGFYLQDLAIPVDRYRIPPKELAELLPQQAIMLETARAALHDADLGQIDPVRTGVFVGLGLDLRTTDFHLRWATLRKTGWNDGYCPALTADRTMGALAGTNASRIAKEFHFGGPSHTVCGEDGSGAKALEIAVRALQLGELDQALAGGVELTGDLRALAGTDALTPYSREAVARPFDEEADGPVPGEGAVALVLKRLDDALRDGNRVYAVVRGIGSAGGGGVAGSRRLSPVYRLALERAYQEAGVTPGSVGFLEASGSANVQADREEARTLEGFFGAEARQAPCHLGCAQADVGHTGAVSGLVAVAKAALALYHEVVPPLRGLRNPIPELAEAKCLRHSPSPQYWVRNRAEGPRRAAVSATSVDGGCTHVVLEGYESGKSQEISRSYSYALGTRSEALFTFHGRDPDDLVDVIESFRERASRETGKSTESLARQWWQDSEHRSSDYRLALVAQDTQQLQRLLRVAADRVRQGGALGSRGPDMGPDRERLFYTRPDLRLNGEMAFVFPGAGNQFADMGRELALHWPEILRTLDRENQFLASQMFAHQFWNETSCEAIGTDHRGVICGQVALGAMVSDLAMYLGLRPAAALGYSLGESTALFALRAWKSRDEMLQRVMDSPLFARDLTGTPGQLRRVWGLPDTQEVEWKAGLVDRSEAEVRSAMAGRQRVYILIVNTPNECVIGGDAPQVEALVADLGCHWLPVEGVSTVHCELLHPVESAYRELHLFETTPPPGIRFYSGGWGHEYVPDRETAANAIVAQAKGCIDFPRVVEAAYRSGIRFFLEIGPGNSCSRMISRILEGRPHWARSLCGSAQEGLLGILRVFAQLFAEGVGIDLDGIYGKTSTTDPRSPRVSTRSDRCVVIPVAGPRFSLKQSAGETARLSPSVPTATLSGLSDDPFEEEVLKAMAQTQEAVIGAHQAYLHFSQGVAAALTTGVQSHLALASQLGSASPSELESFLTALPAEPIHFPAASPSSQVALDRAACLEFARGSVAKVLGADFSLVDSFPTRVRLPDEPLMLVDRILTIEGEARSMTQGRVVTEHDILQGSWYLDQGRIPTCIAVEAGQADLFLSGYLGIDFQTEGRAVYRLLDAKVCFHRPLPGPGSVIHYDIRIDHFFRQANTWLFRFRFEATVEGQPLLTMTDGCAGFFTAEELAGGRGIVQTAMDLQVRPGKRPADWEDFVVMTKESYSSAQLEALRAGDLPGCFGPQFSALSLQRPLAIPSAPMNLVHRIPLLDPSGGRFGLGLIRGEADIHPKDWFLTCHFVDDRVMPGTLMYECCLHTLRVFLLRMGWVAEQDGTHLEPVPEVISQLKCRGQVLETTRTALYEISIKEIGYRPEPYVLADALMYADGKPIVEITNMSLQYSGVTREALRRTWSGATDPTPRPRPAVYDSDRILAFAIGKPSEAFGEPYRVFDQERRIARLPGPPYQFLDRITEVQGEPFKMVAGAVAEAEYDIPSDAWYFAENRQSDMPFAVLLEVALQPCGWLAAYAGSALTSTEDLSFRNLGGKGNQLTPVDASTARLITRVKMTRVSSSAGMIIQWFDLEVHSPTGLVYRGDTYFGFFPKAALAKQEGIRAARLYSPSDAEQLRALASAYPNEAPFAGDMLRMVDSIECFIPDGGPNGLGFIRATKRVEPTEWFFKAHFYQDPVVPGSLGLESFLQLLKYLAIQRWGHSEGIGWEAVATGQPHEWVYRGQILPTDHLVTVEAVVTAIDEEQKLLRADGFLSVDGRVIYGMKDFTVRRQRIAVGATFR